MLSALALAAPHTMKRATGLPRIPALHAEGPIVSVSIDGFLALTSVHAYDGLIQEAARTYRVDAGLIRSVIRAESSFNPLAVSRVGAQGLMQLMPHVAAGLGVEDPFNPRENIRGGVRLLRDLLDRLRGNVEMALASYNAGPSAVRRHGRVPPFRETRAYVKRITTWLAEERAATSDQIGPLDETE